MRPSALTVAVVGPLILYLFLASTTLLRPLNGGDVATWTIPDPPPRSVLLIEADGTRVMAAETGDGLEVASTRWRVGPLEVEHADHRYTTTFRFGPLRLPWMQNEYTSAIPDWPSIIVRRATGSVAAGQWLMVLGGALLLVLASLLVGRELGPVAAATCGLWLATDVWFHAYKKVGNGTELLEQVLPFLAFVFALEALRQGRAKLGFLAGVMVGLGLVTKLPTAAPALAIAVGVLPLRPFRDTERPVRTVAAVVLGVVVGLLPNLAYWADTRLLDHLPGEPRLEGADSWEGRLRESGQSEVRSRKGRKTVDPWTFATAGVRWWASHYEARGRILNARPGERVERPAPPPASGLQRIEPLGVAALIAVAVLGVALRLGEVGTGELGRAALATWLALAALATPVVIRRMHGDAHHMALWLPLLPMALGAGAALAWEAAGPRLKPVVLTLLIVSAMLVPARTASLGRFDAEVEERAGRLMDWTNVRELTAALEEQGATDPAILSYEGMALFEGLTDGRVRPWQYWRANIRGVPGRPAPAHGSDAWLAAVLRAHAGGHLLVIAAPPALGQQPGGRSFWTAAELSEVGRRQGQSVFEVRDLRDARGRWYATLYAVGPIPSAGTR